MLFHSSVLHIMVTLQACSPYVNVFNMTGIRADQSTKAGLDPNNNTDHSVHTNLHSLTIFRSVGVMRFTNITAI